MNTESVWEKVSSPPSYPALHADITTDVLIIGAGITGLTAAWELANAGTQTIVVEALRAGSGTTGHSTGNLYIPVQPYYHNISQKFDADTVRSIAHSRKTAIDYIERTVSELGIDCHFSRRPTYMFSYQRPDFLEREVEALKAAGIGVAYQETMPFPSLAKRIAYLPDQARLNPKTYIDGLAEAYTRAGGQIFENTAVTGLEETAGQCRARAAGHTITASKIIMATHTPKGIHKIQALAAPYRSYVVAATLKGGTYPNGHFWHADPGGYISSTHAVSGPELDMLMVAGGHHKTGQARRGDARRYFEKIEIFIRKNFEAEAILHRWSAQHYQAADGLPYIGLAHRGAKRLYVAGGYFADGLTYGTVAGRILSDLVQGKDHPLANVYDPLRSTTKASACRMIKENLNVLGEYARDIPCPGTPTLTAIKSGEGRIVNLNGEKVAAYRDEKQKLHLVSAVCTHMKCIVRFNNAEKTWDCPCHGSRFAPDGTVLEGPAWAALPSRKETPSS